MRKFNSIAENVFRNLLEAPLPKGVPQTPADIPAGPGPGAKGQAGLPQDGGPVNLTNPKADAEVNRSPAELKTWETELITWAKNALLTIQQDPSRLSSDAIETLSLPTTIENKDTQLDIIKSLGENL